MSKLSEALHEIVSLLRGTCPVALVGGLAVSARCEPRFTRDIDLVVGVEDDAGAEAVVHALVRRGLAIVSTFEQAKIGRLATVRLRRDASSPLVDLLFASSGIELEIAAAADGEIVLGGVVPLATTGHLIAMKLLSRDDARRPRDHDDLIQLTRLATPRDWALALAAVTLIESRGFSRGRGLRAALAEWQREQAPP